MRAIHTGPWSITRGVATAALLAVTAFWTWLALAMRVIGGPFPESIGPIVLFVIPLLAAAAITAVKPRYGGLGLLLVGVLAWGYFGDPGIWAMLALPLVVIGTALAVVGRRPHTAWHLDAPEPDTTQA